MELKQEIGKLDLRFTNKISKLEREIEVLKTQNKAEELARNALSKRIWVLENDSIKVDIEDEETEPVVEYNKKSLWGRIFDSLNK